MSEYYEKTKDYVIYYNEFRIKQILLTIVLIISNMTGRNQ